MDNLYAPWSLSELAKDLSTGKTTADQALGRAHDRIAQTEPTLHAWVTEPSALVRKPEISNGLLAGVPFGVKDIIDLSGFPTRCGSVIRGNAEPARQDASIVKRWRETGAIPLGKTVTTEFAFFAPGPTDNPAALGHTPGGSSSGSAAAVASGQLPLALGSQTAGSVTRPASFCGVASLVMTRGRFPVDGVVGLAESFDSHGFYAAQPEDLAVAWSALTGESVSFTGLPSKILWWNADQTGQISDDMAQALDRVVHALKQQGIEVEPFPEANLAAELTAAHPIVMAYEAARERSAELAQVDRLSEPLANLLLTGESMSEDEYQSARAIITEGTYRIAQTLASANAILGPGALGAAPRGLSATGDPVLSRAWQAAGLPTVGIPGLRDGSGLPLGLQVIGASGGDAALIATAMGVQHAWGKGSS